MYDNPWQPHVRAQGERSDFSRSVQDVSAEVAGTGFRRAPVESSAAGASSWGVVSLRARLTVSTQPEGELTVTGSAAGLLIFSCTIVMSCSESTGTTW